MKKLLYTGPDLSSHNGNVNMSQVVSAGCKRVALRAGYGRNNVDQKYIQNAQACHNLSVPVMIYWFSYALDSVMASNEAEYCIAQARKFWQKCPIAFDLEYDTVRYARTKGVSINKALATDMAISFLLVVKKHGFIPVLYTNRDYLRNYFDMAKITKEVGKVYVWYARYCDSLPLSEQDIPDIWQYSSKERLAGVSGNVDMNRYYSDFDDSMETVKEPSVKKECNLNILSFQKSANKDGYKGADGKQLVEDGIDGKNTQYAMSKILLRAKRTKLLWIERSEGHVVEWLQRRLNECMNAGLPITAEYDSYTVKAVKDFQKAYNLSVDGIAGKEVLNALFYN